MKKVDLHLHTTRYSVCSQLTTEQLRDISQFLPLDGIVITEHDRQWSAEELEELQKESGGNCRFYRGVEVTCCEGHFVAIGLRDNPPISLEMPLKELCELAEIDNAAVIMAHPGRFFPLPPENPGEEWQGIHAIEVMSYNIRQELAPGIVSTMKRLPRPMVAGSDSHAAWNPGMYATMFPELPADEKELAQMIRKGQGVPWANKEHLTKIKQEIPEAHLLLEPPVI